MAGELAAAGISAGASVANTLINQAFAEHNRKRNFYYNEKAADNADKRQRKQYEDLYSPQAMMDQYAAAGLSPSMMMSGGQSAVGQSSAQGNQSAGIQGPYPSAEMFNPQAMANLMLTKAQTENLNVDTAIKEIQKNMQELAQTKLHNEFTLMNLNIGELLGEESFSISEFARQTDKYDDFYKKVKEATKTNTAIYSIVQSEQGQEILRSIFFANHSLENDIAVLSSSKVNAQLQERISRLLYNTDYAESSKDAILAQLNQVKETAQLTATQKQSFNNLIAKLGDGSFKDIIVVLCLVLGNFATNNNFRINTGGTTITNNYNN